MYMCMYVANERTMYTYFFSHNKIDTLIQSTIEEQCNIDVTTCLDTMY